MADTKGQRDSLVINADADTITKVLLDFESYPDWMSGVEETEVLKRDRRKRGTQVRFRVDAVLVKLNYVLSYSYEEEDAIEIGYVEGDLEDTNARYEFKRLSDDRTEATYYFEVKYSLPKTLRGPLVGRLLKQVDKRVMKSALRDLKSRVESV